MKKIMLALLLVGSLQAEEFSMPQNQAEMFKQMKTKMLPAFKKMVPIYKDLQKCYEKKYSKANYIKCTKNYAPKMEAIAATLVPAGSMKKRMLPSDEEFKAFAWTKKVHKNVIDQIAKMGKVTAGMQNCIQTSEDLTAFSVCSQSLKQIQ